MLTLNFSNCALVLVFEKLKVENYKICSCKSKKYISDILVEALVTLSMTFK